MTEKTISILEGICTKQRGINLTTLEQVIVLAIEIAREGREGRKIGTIFVISDSENVIKNSRCLILDPLGLHPNDIKHVSNSDLRETVKELAQLDGAFVVSDSGVFLSACRHLNVSSEGIHQPLGLGSRHMAAASITRQTRAVAVVVSESSIVRVFDDGEVIGEIIPELWMMRNYSLHLTGPYSTRTMDQVTAVSKND